jgi:hypothetical protein
MPFPSDITTLNRLYLIKARELALQGEESRATYLLGIPTEALSIIRKMPLSAIDELAESGLLTFGFRTALPCLKAFAAATQEGSPASMNLKLQLLASHKIEGQRREPHGRALS